MNYVTLRQDIHDEAAKRTLEILSEFESDILVLDYDTSKEVNFHMVPPTREWLTSRIIWGPSLTCDDTPDWSKFLADYLSKIDPAMFICLNRIIVTDEPEDRKAVAGFLKVDEDNLPEENEDNIGQLWFQENCVFVYVSALRATTKEMLENAHLPLSYYQEMRIGFLTTLLHKIRHLGLDCNFFLPEDEYPVILQSEEAIECWAQEMFEIM